MWLVGEGLCYVACGAVGVRAITDWLSALAVSGAALCGGSRDARAPPTPPSTFSRRLSCPKRYNTRAAF
ncbi:unnamed protein product [Arctia plantaginis]|uniref:Uncharacterized protein n=1 Tax=Arctia plantaginis TaxID=874455 RepID=A0A8S0Z9T2_ARCPL|nr:unnamed protein product [Arctia plantaginis]